jgi:O-antigen ligase
MVRAALAAVLLAVPTVLAFRTGGYLDEARAWAGLVVWLVAAGALVTARRRPPLLALSGLAGLAASTLLSVTWAPVSGPAWDLGQTTMLYLGALLAGALLLRERARVVEPALALGIVLVVGYALSERLLPGLLEFDRSVSAKGRLEQPLTYWNALGALAALGIVLVARLAGDASRSPALRCTAAAAAAPLAMGLSLTVSRGALFACGAGLLTLVVAAGRREQLRAVAVVVATGVLAAIVVEPFKGVTSFEGSLSTRERDGAIVLALLLVLMAVAAVVARVSSAEETPGPLLLPRWAPLAALGVVVVGFTLAVTLGGDEQTAGALTPGAERYATFTSNRKAYWKVAVRAFADDPVAGVGAEGWAVRWRKERPFREGAHDAHSLYLQTAAELGLVGLALLAVWLAGIVVAARDTLRHHGSLVAGYVAGIVVWASHVALDWDFQMPAATLPAILLMGGLVALTAPPRSAAPRG